MFTNVEDFVKAQSEAFKATNTVATTAFEGAKKLAELNMQTAKAGIEESTAQVKALLAAKDVKALTEMITASFSQMAKPEGKAAHYAKSVYEISSATGTEVGSLIEKQVATTQKQILASVEALAKNAPAGSEGLVNIIKQGVVTANSAYDQMHQASKQLVDMLEANLSGAAKAASSAAKKR